MPGFHDGFVWLGDFVSESRVEQGTVVRPSEALESDVKAKHNIYSRP